MSEKNNIEHPKKQPLSAKSYAVISFIGLVMAIGSFVFFYAQTDGELGKGRLFYLILLVVGVGVAAFFFGVMRSFAVYQGQEKFSGLSIGGPIVAGVLVVYGGYKLIPEEDQNFIIKVQLASTVGEKNELSEGTISIKELEMKPKKVGSDLQVVFADIDAKYLGKEVHFNMDIEGFQLSQPDSGYLLKKDNFITLNFERDQSLSEVRGVVYGEEGNPAIGVTVLIHGHDEFSTTTSNTGTFNLKIPQAYQRDSIIIRFVSNEYRNEQYTAYPGNEQIGTYRLIKSYE